MYCFFDTETTGIPDYNKDLTDVAQPHIVQLALLLADEDGREVAVWKRAIIPEGYSIDEGGKAYQINKIGNSLVNKYGVSLKSALAMLYHFESLAELKIAHNYRFDGFLLKCAHARAGVEPINPAIDRYCTMKAIADIRGTKFPKLSEIYKEITGRDLEGAHDALADVRACKDVFFWIKKNNLYKKQERYVPPADGKAAA
jgi:DNA polymerase-3 subunit epsilon